MGYFSAALKESAESVENRDEAFGVGLNPGGDLFSVRFFVGDGPGGESGMEVEPGDESEGACRVDPFEESLDRKVHS